MLVVMVRGERCFVSLLMWHGHALNGMTRREREHAHTALTQFSKKTLTQTRTNGTKPKKKDETKQTKTIISRYTKDTSIPSVLLKINAINSNIHEPTRQTRATQPFQVTVTHTLPCAFPRGIAVGGGGGPRLLPAMSLSLSKAESLSLSVDASGVVPSSDDTSSPLRNRMRRCVSEDGRASPTTSGWSMTSTVQRALIIVDQAGWWSSGAQVIAHARCCQLAFFQKLGGCVMRRKKAPGVGVSESCSASRLGEARLFNRAGSGHGEHTVQELGCGVGAGVAFLLVVDTPTVVERVGVLVLVLVLCVGG